MTEKLALLEERVQETVEDVGGIVKDVEGMVKDVKATVHTTLAAVRQGVAGAQSSVEEIVEQVKGTIGETAATMQRTLDLPAQMEQHPWSMFGGAMFVGYLLGSWSDSRQAAGPTAARAPAAVRYSSSHSAAPASVGAAPSQPGLVSDVLGQLQDKMQDEVSTLKSAAVGAVMSTLRAMVKQAVPVLAPYLDQARTRPGGQGQHIA
jgi:ElaB/YqjD/DUF883 family membrane-anchored ribosome-binding protein